jgi:hypothetical protein
MIYTHDISQKTGILLPENMYYNKIHKSGIDALAYP